MTLKTWQVLEDFKAKDCGCVINVMERCYLLWTHERTNVIREGKFNNNESYIMRNKTYEENPTLFL